MRSPKRPIALGIPLSFAFLMAAVALPGCKKDSSDESSSEESSEESKEEEKKEEEVKKEEEPEKVVQAEPEPIPVEPLHTGLDLMLSFVPADASEYVIVRDPTVLQEYAEEAARFLDGPLARLAADPLGSPAEIEEHRKNLDKMTETSKAIELAVASSGLQLKEGVALIQTEKKKSLVVFNAEDVGALAELDKALKEAKVEGFKKTHEKCKSIEGAEGWHVCADDQGTLDAYALNEDPKTMREGIEKRIEGIDLDEANVLATVIENKQPLTLAVTTLPGLVHMAMAVPPGNEAREPLDALAPGDAKTMAIVQPGAGFIWGRAKPESMSALVGAGLGGTPPEAKAFLDALTGEFIVAGSVSPGGLVFQAGLSDMAPFTQVLAMADALKAGVPTEIPDVPDAKLAFDRVSIEDAGKTADALHIGVSGLPEGNILKSFTGLHLDAWTFAADNLMTVAVGPNKENIGKLIGTGADGPSKDTLATLPPQLAEGIEAKRVSFVMHFPLDFLHGVHMQKLVRGSLKDVPFAKPDQVLAAMAVLSPLSSATVWVANPGDEADPVLHVAVQGIGNRATDEGKAALDAAKAVADGADPEAAFGTLASSHPSSAMLFAYKTRAGTDGPGSLVGSGLGAIAATAAVAVPVALGVRNEALADDLGVKPEDPEPVVAIVTPPVQPKHEPKPKADPKPKPKTDPKPKPASDDPLPVEPDRPLPPKPTVDPDDPTPPKPATDDPAPKPPIVRPNLPPGVKVKKK